MNEARPYPGAGLFPLRDDVSPHINGPGQTGATILVTDGWEFSTEVLAPGDQITIFPHDAELTIAAGVHSDAAGNAAIPIDRPVHFDPADNAEISVLGAQ